MVLGQEFQISSGSAVMPFTVDPFTKVIYYRNFFNYKTMSVNIDGSNEIETFFPTVPSFAHLEHKAAYFVNNTGDDSLFIYNFNDGSTHYLLKSFSIDVGSVLLSPNDTKMLFSKGTEISNYYSFDDSLLHDLNIGIYSNVTEWKDDSTLFCLSSGGYGEGTLIKISLTNDSLETLLSAPDTVTYTGFSYNSELDIIAYAWEYYGEIGTNVGINLLKLKDNSDSTIFDYYRDDPIGAYIDYQYLGWSPDNDKLGFLGVDAINPLTQVYVYYTKTNEVIRYTEPFYTDEGIKYDLNF